MKKYRTVYVSHNQLVGADNGDYCPVCPHEKLLEHAEDIVIVARQDWRKVGVETFDNMRRILLDFDAEKDAVLLIGAPQMLVAFGMTMSKLGYNRFHCLTYHRKKQKLNFLELDMKHENDRPDADRAH